MRPCSPLGIAVLLCAILVAAGPATSAPKVDLAPLSRDLDKMGSEICKSLKLTCKKAKKTQRKAAERPTRKKNATRRAAPAKVEAKAAQTTKPAPKPDRHSQVATTPDRPLVPVPRPKPVMDVPPPPTAPVLVVVPRQKPVILKPAEEKVAAIPRAETPIAEEKVAPMTRVAPPLAEEKVAAIPRVAPLVVDEACLVSLRNNKVEFDEVASPKVDGNCSIAMPVRLRAVETSTGKVSLPEGPVLNCRFALQFALWLSDTGAPAIAAQTNKKLVKVATGPGYVCRGRNGDSSAKLSEHAFGNAVDITTITTDDGEAIQISDAIDPASPSYQVLRGLRTTACGYFSTVLGPGANAAHASHFHFDMGLHGKSGNYKICE